MLDKAISFYPRIYCSGDDTNEIAWEILRIFVYCPLPALPAGRLCFGKPYFKWLQTILHMLLLRRRKLRKSGSKQFKLRDSGQWYKWWRQLMPMTYYFEFVFLSVHTAQRPPGNHRNPYRASNHVRFHICTPAINNHYYTAVFPDCRTRVPETWRRQETYGRETPWLWSTHEMILPWLTGNAGAMPPPRGASAKPAAGRHAW